jgi:hypothetical protein
LEIATHCAVAGHDDPAGGERHAGGFRARQGGQLALNGLGDAAAHVGVRGQEDHLRVRAVFRLRQQVGGDKVRGGAAVGDHQHFRRAGRHVDGRAVQTLADLAFGFRDVSVARAKDFIHLRHRLGAEGEGGDGLGAADVKDGFRRTAARQRISSAIGGGEQSTTC